MNNYISRTNILNFDKDILDTVAKYKLGDILTYKVIEEGYEDLNVDVTTTVGHFFFKFFTNVRSFKQIMDYLEILIKAREYGIRVPYIYRSNDNSTYFEVEPNTYVSVLEFFEGNNLVNEIPSTDEINTVTEFLGKLNSIQLKVEENYDSWGVKNFSNELTTTISLVVDPNIRNLIERIHDDFNKIDFSNFKKGLIHGDLQRKHILKNKLGELCLIDFGCANYDYLVLEVAVFIAFFCLNFNLESDKTAISAVLESYSKYHHLSKPELNSMYVLIRSCFCIYYLKSNELIAAGDSSSETKEWNELALKGMNYALFTHGKLN